jgi:hypothetical protein
MSHGIRESVYLFPAIEVVHLFGLVMLLGTVAVVNLRLLGFGMRHQTASRVAEGVAAWTQIGMGVMLASGGLLFVSEALKCYQNPAFWWKMGFLLAALVFHFTVYRKITSSENVGHRLSVLTGSVSLMLWFGVGLAGRAIAFV